MQKPQNYPTQPEHLWNHFFDFTQTPRPSKEEEKIRQHLIGLAEKYKHEYKTDDEGNIVIYVPGSKDKENLEPVIIQNHIDMVTDATPDRKINFSTDPIITKVEGDWLKADRTTLGADNGIGCAAALALMTDDSISHPPLELLFYNR
jgi:dipeptidase D